VTMWQHLLYTCTVLLLLMVFAGVNVIDVLTLLSSAPTCLPSDVQDAADLGNL
jgi:hypothetical protein